MQQTNEALQMSLSFASIWEIAIIFGVIFAVGIFLIKKGRKTISSRR